MQFIVKLFILLIPIFVFLFYFPHSKSRPARILMAIFLLGISSFSFLRMVNEISVNYYQPPPWDFLAFWLNGKAGISGENFYHPESYREIELPYEPGDDFREEIIDTGFWYPPFTMFLFLPLSLFNFSNAYLFWQILNLLIFGACVYGLWQLFLKDRGILSLLMLAMLMLRAEPTRSTFETTQTNFLALLFFLMFWRNRLNIWGGVWLALCVVIKPYMALLYIYPLVTRNWKMLAAAILTLAGITFLSIITFGSDVFLSFLHHPTPDVPGYVYTEGVNQSLLATILRLSPYGTIKGAPLSNPLYLGISLLLTFITMWVAIRKRNNDEWLILSILFLAFIVYPTTLAHYGVFLIVPVALLLQQSGQNIGERIAIFFAIAVAYFLSIYKFPDYMFFANLFMWLICIMMTVRPGFEKANVYDSVLAPAMNTDSVELSLEKRT
jgi:hypothetical protein